MTGDAAPLPSPPPPTWTGPAPDGGPAWFRRALAVPHTDERVEVAGVGIHYLAWGDVGRRGLVFVHGGGAHAHWWTHVAATFARRLRVLAIDLSGHGDSGHRSEYSLAQWTDEVMAVAEDGGIEGPPVIVGHSMGGFVTIGTAALHSDRLAGVVVCDSPVTEPDPEVNASRLGSAFGAPRTYPTVDAALDHFRTVPPQDHYLDYVIDHVARNSLRAVDGGWQWKFDRQVFAQFASGMRSIALPYLSEVRCRLALLRSENGLVTADIGAEMYDKLGRVAPVIEIPEAGHHAMLDQPLLLLTALRTLLADWDHSEPHRRAGRSVRRRRWHAAGVDDRFEPELIDIDRDEGVTITYHDGHVVHFDLERLRKGCPCAACRGLRDRGEPAWPRPGSPTPLRIESAHRHGAWGIVFVWNDRHDTGIFPFDALRRWADGGDAFAPDSGLGGSPR